MRDLVLGERRPKPRDILRLNRLGPSLIVVLSEQLHAIAAAQRRRIDRFVMTTRNRLMSARMGMEGKGTGVRDQGNTLAAFACDVRLTRSVYAQVPAAQSNRRLSNLAERFCESLQHFRPVTIAETNAQQRLAFRN